MRSIYDIPLNSAEGSPNFLDQFKGKATLIVNTTVGCGNANQLEVLQWLQDKYGGDDFQVIGIPTNDYCGPGVTKGKWSEGITCGLDSKNYGKETYGVTFQYSEMVGSNPNPLVTQELGKNGLGQESLPTHPMYKEISLQMAQIKETNYKLGIKPSQDHYSWWLNLGFDDGVLMGGNFEKYLIDKDGYVIKHYTCTVLNYDIEKTLRDTFTDAGHPVMMGMGRSKKIFQEEYDLVSKDIESAISGQRSMLNNERVAI
jgi:glutathione peroxidase-family protein